MRNIDSHYEHYEKLIETVGTDKIQARYEYLYQMMANFIARFAKLGHEGQLKINERILMHCVLEYFEDIEKVKSAHDLEHTNSPKVVAYTAYWILRRHPIQIVGEDDSSETLVFANEKFVLTMLMSNLTFGSESKPLVGDQLDIYKAFANSLYYYLKFRKLDAQALEMMILAFRAGGLFPECNACQ